MPYQIPKSPPSVPEQYRRGIAVIQRYLDRVNASDAPIHGDDFHAVKDLCKQLEAVDRLDPAKRQQ